MAYSSPFETMGFGAWNIAQSRLYHTNSGLFVDGDLAWLVDPGIYPDEIGGQAAYLIDRELNPVGMVLTHSHWDHILGPERLPEMKMIGRDIFKQTGQEKQAIIAREIARWEAESGLARTHPFVLPELDITFDSSLELETGRSYLVLYAAPGHSADQCVVYHPDSGLLWAGDMLSDLEIPMTNHSLVDYRTTLDTLAALPVRSLVPGHGAPTSQPAEIAARFSHDRTYLAELEGQTAAAVQHGYSLVETLQRCAAIHYKKSPDNAQYHRLNVESAFIAAGGEADSSRLGWSQQG